VGLSVFLARSDKDIFRNCGYVDVE